MGRLAGKVAVITGGGTSIGRAAATPCIEEGAFVLNPGRRQDALDAAVAGLGPEARAVRGPVCDEADLDCLYAAVGAERGTLDVVFANAGTGRPLPLGLITAAHIDETLDTHVKGTILTVQKALPPTRAGGSVILTGSSARTTGPPAFGAYAAKGGGAQPRADPGGGPEGHRHPGRRAVAWADGDRAREGGAGRGGPEGLRRDEPAPAQGRPGGDRGDGRLPRLGGAHPDVAKALPDWRGKIIVDVTNTRVPPEELGDRPSSRVVAQAFPGGRLVKGFNHLVAAVLGQDPAVHGGRRVVFLASDDEGAAAEIGTLAGSLGFAPIELGGLSEGGLLVQARGASWGRLIFEDLVKFDGE